MPIKFYKSNEPYGFLNNFKKSPIFIYGRWWRNVEAAYQSRKFSDLDHINRISSAKTAREARELGQIGEPRSDWSEIKYQVMMDCVLAKFLQNHDLRLKLLETGEEYLIEDSPVDSYWGWGPDGKGDNNLGKILMEVREILKLGNLVT